MKKTTIWLIVVILSFVYLDFLGFIDSVRAQSDAGVRGVEEEDLIERYSVGKALSPAIVATPPTFSTSLRTASLGATKPNIIVIITDDQAPNTIGLAGNSVIKTPNIDRLGKEGIYFKNMYVPTGQCAPSRASLWTGKMPHAHGVITNGLLLPDGQVTLPEILKSTGYQTAFIGKCHLGQAKERFQFDWRIETDGIPDATKSTYNTWYGYQILRNGVVEERSEYITDFLTNETISYIKSAQKPFFLWLAHPAPHLPTIPPRGSNRYSIDQIPTPVSITDDSFTKPPQQQISTRQFYLDKGWPAIKSFLKDTYEIISNMDNNVGRIMNVLSDLQIRNDTLVIYLSDNGLLFGEHQQYGKGPTFYEEQMKTPFIISYPALVKQGKTTDALSSTTDVLPTLLDILGISLPIGIQGTSFLPVLTGEQSTYRPSLLLEYAQQGNNKLPMRGIIANGYKWTHYLASTIGGVFYDGKDYELYDLHQDPYEMNNIMKRLGKDDHPLARMITNVTYGSIVRRLRREMAVWQTDTKDPYGKLIKELGIQPSGDTSLTVTWKTEESLPSEIEWRESSCGTCPIKSVRILR
ncbi:sulfatase-like hydrolase/transferase [Candidatus Gottesmanbacteria bacterium]|nr:sulfatase-like hydrolase/transferase [Candidatus Gottesmanbacteria bacterium]